MAATTIYRPIEILLAGVSDSNGVAVDSGKVRFYSPNTVVTQTVWQDEQGTVAWPQPIELNANGQAVVYAKENVRMVVKDSTEFVTYIDDTITAIRFEQVIGSVTGFFGGDQSSLQQFFQAANSSFGQGFQYLASTTSAFAVARNYTAVLKERAISVKDFGATGNGTTDDAPSVRAAIAELKLVPGGTLWWPAGTYKLNDELLFDFSGWTMAGAGYGSTVINFGVNNKAIRLETVFSAMISGLRLDNDIIGGTVPLVDMNNGGNLWLFNCDLAPQVLGIRATTADGVRIHDNNMSTGGSGAGPTYVQLNSTTNGFVRANSMFANVGGAIGVELTGSTARGVVVENIFRIETGIKVDVALSGQGFVLGPNIVKDCTTPLDIAATGDIQAVFGGQAGNIGGTGDASSYDVTAAGSILHSGHNILNLTGGPTTVNNMQNSFTGDIITIRNGAAGNNTIAHAGGTAANYRPFSLVGAANFVMTPNDTLTARYMSGIWHEIGRAII